MMRLQHFEGPVFEAIGGLHPDLFLTLRCQPVSGAISVGQWACRIVERFCIHVLQVSSIIGAYPAEVFIMTNIRKRKTKARVSGEIPAFVAVHMSFIDLTRAEEWKMRVDQ